jgi:hypothetical protein
LRKICDAEFHRGMRVGKMIKDKFASRLQGGGSDDGELW